MEIIKYFLYAYFNFKENNIKIVLVRLSVYMIHSIIGGKKICDNIQREKKVYGVTIFVLYRLIFLKWW